MWAIATGIQFANESFRELVRFHDSVDRLVGDGRLHSYKTGLVITRQRDISHKALSKQSESVHLFFLGYNIL